MKKRIIFSLALMSAIVFASVGCANSAPDHSTTENQESDSDGSNINERGESAYEELAKNSHIVRDANGVRTLTITLNNGATVECAYYSGEFLCFPELSGSR